MSERVEKNNDVILCEMYYLIESYDTPPRDEYSKKQENDKQTDSEKGYAATIYNPNKMKGARWYQWTLLYFNDISVLLLHI